MPVPYEELSTSARAALFVSVAAFSVGELLPAFRMRRGATGVSVRAEIFFRALFFSGILLLAVGRAVAPGAEIGGGVWVFRTRGSGAEDR